MSEIMDGIREPSSMNAVALYVALEKMVRWHGRRRMDSDELFPAELQEAEVAEAMRALADHAGCFSLGSNSVATLRKRLLANVPKCKDPSDYTDDDQLLIDANEMIGALLSLQAGSSTMGEKCTGLPLPEAKMIQEKPRDPAPYAKVEGAISRLTEIGRPQVSERTILANARRICGRRFKHLSNWALAMEAFGLGRTWAWALCERIGVDPDGRTMEPRSKPAKALENRKAGLADAHSNPNPNRSE